MGSGHESAEEPVVTHTQVIRASQSISGQGREGRR